MATDKRKEKLSAFLDNDMHRDELMSFSLSAEADDAKVVQRYQILGDALRGEVSDSSFVDVSAAVRDAVSDITLADVTLADAALVNGSKTTSTEQPLSKSGLFDISAWFRPVAGMAMAVTVAVLVVFTVTESDKAGTVPVASNVDDLPAAVQLASDSKDSKGLSSEANSVAVSSGIEAPVDRRLVNQHLEFATQDTLQGRLPYVRAVSFESTGLFEPENSSKNATESAFGNSNETGK